MAIEMKNTKVKMNRPIYLGMSILDIRKTLMYEFWYDYIKLKYKDKAKLCYMDTDSFVIYVKAEDFYEDLANDIEKWFDTSNYDYNRPLPIGKNKKVIGLFKDELGGNIMREFVGHRLKTYAYLMDYDTENKKAKAKGTKKCIVKRELMFKNYKNCLLHEKIRLESQQRFKSYCHNVYTEQVVSINDDKNLQTLDKITAYPCGTNALEVYESEISSKIKIINFEDYVNENKTQHNLKWPRISDHP